MILPNILGNCFAQDTSFFKTKEIIVIDTNTSNSQKYGGLNYRKIIISKKDNLINYKDLFIIPSVNLIQYGGLGSLSSISIRGTSSNQAKISINSIPLNNSANPFYDLNLLPFEIIDEINIIPTGNSAQFGSGAIGGIVDLSVNNHKSNHLTSYFSFGSYGYYKIHLSQKNYIPFAKNLSNSISYESYLGNYPIKFNEFGRIVDTFRTNSSYHSFKVSNIFKKNFNKNISFSSISFFSSNYQEQPGAVLLGRLEDKSSNLKQIHLSSLNSIEYLSDFTNYTFSSSINIKDLNYSPSELPFSTKNYFTGIDFFSSLKISSKMMSLGNVHTEMGVEYNQLTGNMLQKEVGSFINRTLVFLSVSNSNVFNNLPLSYNISTRVDKILNYSEIPVSGLLAINYFPYENTKLNLSFSKNFRFPSFNEMYYFNYGNINLLPEKSISSEVSFDYLSPDIEFQINGFVSNIVDKIVSIPKSTLTWTAQNYSKVLNYGFETSFSIDMFNNHLNIKYYYLLQNSLDNNPNSKNYKSMISYVPNEKIALLTTVKYELFNLALNVQRNSFRYFLSENSPQNILPSYLIINSSLKYELTLYKSINTIISFDINNLTNISYEIVKNYPMPGRTFYLTIRASYE